VATVPTVVIVRLSCTIVEFVPCLSDVDGARFIRELAPDRAVVQLAHPQDQLALARLPCVVAVHPDQLEHPTGRG
jgi:hypothetical protein